jgi:hypothetical protein
MKASFDYAKAFQAMLTWFAAAAVAQLEEATWGSRSSHTWPEDSIHIPAIRTGGPLRLSGHAEMVYNTGQNVIQRGVCNAQEQSPSSRTNA